MVKVSVIIPVYNVEKFLQACIDSLLCQTLKEIEFIFINDNSPDKSLEILLKNEKKHPNKIRVIDSKENLCQGGARNLGIRVAKGEYVGFVDSDDMVAPNMFELLYKQAIKTKSDVTFIQYATIDENSEFTDVYKGIDRRPIIEWNEKLLNLENKNLTELDRMDLIAYPVGGVYCGLWKKKLIFDNNIFFPERLKYEDNYWGSLIKCYITKVSFVKKIGYYYRQNSNSTVHSHNAKFQYDRETIEKMLLNEVADRGLFEIYLDAWEYCYTYRATFNTCFMYIQRFDKPPISKIIEAIRNLEKMFPNWKENKYYQELTSDKRKFTYKMIVKFPRFVVMIYLIKKTISVKMKRIL